MASVYIQNKRGREEFWSGGFGLPEAKRMNMGHDTTDLMALLDRIDNIDYIEKNNNETGFVVNEGEEERLNVVIKSLEDEIGLKPNNVEETVVCVYDNVACVDNVVACGDDEKKGGVDDNTRSLVDEISNGTDGTTTSVSELASQGSLYYDGELGFFMDHAAAHATDDLGIIMSHCQSAADHSMSNFYLDSLHGYADNTEVFYGSLWEDDIWHVNDHGAFFQNGGSCSTTQQEVENLESQDVADDLRPRQCLSAGEEGA
ncbi:hypothetical protein SUGI_0075070 [Cryptomeria japonica]|uniref:uncharacterized protein LOC131039781 n=1 Tax=Cryptomeria japonica TaxID=3369 RepID=UPI002408DC42|nr:uncharacterized protein LOC131039781 [Cryptomeria japonica]GLJ07833.1 hypothetical protein SUGI_0075070 [Cryptomeria japonica]